MTTALRTMAVWLEPQHLPLVRETLGLLGVKPVLAGSPTRGQSRTIATELDCASADDLRGVMVEGEAQLVWIVSAGAFGDSAESDAQAASAARGRGVHVVTSDALPTSALDAAGPAWAAGEGASSPAQSLRFAPALRTCRAVRESAEILAEIGRPRVVFVASLASASESTLGARLFDAAEIVRGFMGEAESVHAAFAPINAPTSTPAPPAESLRGLAGDLSISLRWADGRAASIVASDRACGWQRRVTVIGEKGRLTLTDTDVEWHNAQGQVAEHSRLSKKKGETASPAAMAYAEAIGRLADPAIPDDGPSDTLGVLTLCQTILLSARTKQAESLATIRRMIEVG